jgi:putative transposase
VLPIAPSTYDQHAARKVGRCERLMRQMGLCGVVRGKPVRTTVSDQAQPCPQDRVSRQFRAERPNALRVPRFTYVLTWQGVVYVAFVTDVFAQYVSIRYSERLKEAGVEPSVGSVGDSCDTHA